MGAAAAMGAFDQTPQYNNAPAPQGNAPQGGGYNQGGYNQPAQGGYAQQQAPANRNFNQAPQQPQYNAPPASGFDSFDDDIPF